MVVSVLLGVDSISPSGILGWNTTRMKEKQLSRCLEKGCSLVATFHHREKFLKFSTRIYIEISIDYI